jgi:hypothetical protein
MAEVKSREENRRREDATTEGKKGRLSFFDHTGFRGQNLTGLANHWRKGSDEQVCPAVTLLHDATG